MRLYLILLLLLFSQQGKEFELAVNITGLKPLKGDLYISLHNRPEFFQVADSAFMKMKIAVNEENETVVFSNVPAGTYAIALYHDENLNGIMETNEKGIPREGFGFSTKSKFLGRPKFEQAEFVVTENLSIEIKMIYPLSGTAK